MDAKESTVPRTTKANPPTFEVGPFLLYRSGNSLGRSGRLDVILVEAGVEGDRLGLHMPQFGIRFWMDLHSASEGAVLDTFARRILMFYAGLRDLPDDFINEVERCQIRLIEDVFLPWFALELGRNPKYVGLPETRVLIPVSNLQAAAAG